VHSGLGLQLSTGIRDMITALLADIHANREALSACLAHARQAQAQRFAFLGDLVGYGPDPGWVVDTVSAYAALGAAAVLGNHDSAVVRGPDVEMQAEAAEAAIWTQAHLTGAQLDFLSKLPLQVEEQDRLFVHANAWAPAEWEYIIRTADAEKSLHATRQRYTFCGHVHDPTLYHLTEGRSAARFTPTPGIAIPLGSLRRWLIIVGSVGQPRDGNPAACYALFDDAAGTLTFFRVPYDNEATARKIRVLGLPPNLAARIETGT
jgi:diadenosine tetraphosphatase ApaH/serine/threonine PP2A family protein phosphatase